MFKQLPTLAKRQLVFMVSRMLEFYKKTCFVNVVWYNCTRLSKSEQGK